MVVDKLKLAYISPMPPQKSGIADYSATLISYLKVHYTIDSITESASEKFKQNYKHYDRILYHFGNSPYHLYMIKLLAKIPGIVVLHDFYLGNLMAMAHKIDTNALYYAHGYRATQEKSQQESVTKYPCNREIIEHALSIIVHSNYAKHLTQIWYRNIATIDTIPLLREPVTSLEIVDISFLPKEAFVVASFGLVSAHKLAYEIVHAWKQSLLSHDTNAYLVFVGEATHSDYIQKLRKLIDDHPRILITGWVDANHYRNYLTVTDIAIQLRCHSRGESSASLLDTMNYGIATITNAHGANSEIPQSYLYQLPDHFTMEQLTNALNRLYSNSSLRKRLAQTAKEYVSSHHAPKQVAQHYFEIIEKHYATVDALYKERVYPLSMKSSDIPQLVHTIDQLSLHKTEPKQILIDVSEIYKHDLQTGIQRVVRSQIIELIRNAPSNYRIEPVYLVEENKSVSYYYARTYTAKLLQLDHLTLYDAPITMSNGDIFYGLDLCAYAVSKSIELYRQYRLAGVKIVFMVYDLLPITHPEFFPPEGKQIHTTWLNNIAQVANQLMCISNKVAKEVRHFVPDPTIDILSLHLGANITPQQLMHTSRCYSEDKPIVFLMVGTVEPRKGHADVLEAFERLWTKGHTIHLHIIGKRGWMVEELCTHIEQHPKRGHQLFYFEQVDDATLHEAYRRADAVIVASIDEGFGLPLIEAALYATPIITRDIEVFREVAGEYAYYFDQDLAYAIEQWLLLYQANRHPSSEGMPYMTWEENAKRLLEIL